MSSDASYDRAGGSSPPARSRVSELTATPGGFEQRLLARARDGALGRGDRLVVGFSGGRDSLALAAALRRVQTVLGVELLLVHVNHLLRSSSSDEAVAAARLAAILGLPFRVEAAAEPPQRLHPHVGIEQAARRERYRLLFEVATEAGARAVVTAHHEQDQAETVLLHVLRGAGVHGAAGMGEWTAGRGAATGPASDISHEGDAARLWRPMLWETRAAIDAYVAQLGLAWIEDPSNLDESLRRNALRRQILPVLEEHFPGAIAALARYATLAAGDDEALDDVARAILADDAVDPGGRLAITVLRNRPRGLQRRMVRRWLEGVTGLGSLTAERTEAVLDLASSGRGESGVEIGEAWTVRREGEMLRASLVQPETRSASEREGPP